MSAVISLLITYLLSNEAPTKDAAREYIKRKLDGWQETAALIAFELAWDIALARVGQKIGSLNLEQAELVADLIVDSQKEYVSKAILLS